ncbi:MAG TPA: class I SAM-dependent methyltransferase, partial [Candidatus Omnitrophota bacterium]|nr:class I SAM-dependent methyltransferase [Candidatus Omnitrophota bacterium]
KWIDICRAQYAEGEKLKFFLADGDDLVDFKKGQFDVVTANMVFLNVPDARKIDRMFGEVSRVLKTGGQFIFSDCHPLMMVAAKVDTRVGAPPKDFHYFKDGVQHKLKCLLTDYSTIEFRDSHWSLGFYSTVLKKNGMMIEEIVEPKPYKLDPRKRLKDYRTPEYIIFKCRKVLGGIVSVR